VQDGCSAAISMRSIRNSLPTCATFLSELPTHSLYDVTCSLKPFRTPASSCRNRASDSRPGPKHATAQRSRRCS